MSIERGSVWNRWDFHVHTPYSALNNQFGFNPSLDYQKNIEQFDEYVKQLFTKAVDNNVTAIGITDYFFVDGYKRIQQEYIKKPDKMREIFPNESLKAKVERIYIFPNIELRLDTFVGEKAHSVNYHVIFSDKIPIQNIEERFINKLNLSYRSESIPLNKNSIAQIGHEYKENNNSYDKKYDDYLVGMEKATVNYRDIVKVLNDCNDFKDKFLLTITVDEDLSNISWGGRDYETRRTLYQQCNCFLSSNPGTIKFALAKGHEEKQIREFGAIKPCIWGSDAHSYAQMFKPNLDRYCWIKGDATFEGLKQILYEPEERVKIQKDCPYEKNAHYIIDHIVFNDKNFDNNPIYLSEGLTTIIGGKSTGKSILLRHIAKSIDKQQVLDKESQLVSSSKKLEVDAKVLWKDGESGNRKIIYIPQSWLNRIVDENNNDNQLNSMIRDILLQQQNINLAHINLNKDIEEILKEVKNNIEEYISCIKNAEEYEKKLKEYGRSEAFLAEIKRLEKQREEISTTTGIRGEELQYYSELEKTIIEKKEILNTLEKEKTYIKTLQKAYIYIPGITTDVVSGNQIYNLDNVNIPMIKESLEKAIENVNATISETWESILTDISHTLINETKNTNEEITELSKTIEPLRQIVVKSDQLEKINSQLKEENKRLMDISDIVANPAIKHFNLNTHIKPVNLALKTES